MLAQDFDPANIPDRFTADFDGDGTIDRVIVTDTSLQVSLSGGGEYTYIVGESPLDQSARISDVEIQPLDQDQLFPSIVLATRGPTTDGLPTPTVQQVIVNDGGTLSPRRLWPLAVDAVSVDCAWIKSNDLPVCFYASYGLAGSIWMGVSRLVEIDAGWHRLLADSAARARASHTLASREAWLQRLVSDSSILAWKTARRPDGHHSAREMAKAFVRMDGATFDRILMDILPIGVGSASDTFVAVSVAWLERAGPRELARTIWPIGSEEYDSILAVAGIRQPASGVDAYLTVFRALYKPVAVYANDVTRQYRLPWPVQVMAFLSSDGFHMEGAQFFDFSGDGLLDLIVVGEHSRIFSAVQHEDGYFVEAQYHSSSDEYLDVFAPEPETDPGLTVPPCVYIAMEWEESSYHYADYVECYDRTAREWYEVDLPGGRHSMREWDEAGLPEEVMFWDINDDGMIDFAAKKDDGTWTSFTFVVESG